MVVRQDEVFMQEFQKCLVFALEEFGKKTVGRWQEQISRIMHRLKMMPESYPFVVDLWDLRQDPRKLNMRARRIERKDYH